MKYRLLDFLACPDCGGELRVTVFKEKQVACGVSAPAVKCRHSCWLEDSGKEMSDCSRCYSFEIETGILVCTRDHIFPIIGHIPRMLPDAFCGLENFIDEFKDRLPLREIQKAIDGREIRTFARMQKNTQESFGYQWLRYDVNDDREDREIFLSDSQLSENELRGKVILDAGCGMGRYTRVAGQMGGEIIGIDLSWSILKAHQKTVDNPCVHIIQGDLLNLPFRKKQFDVIYSLGVLHHTPDPRKAFTNLSSCLKEKGIMSIWVYGTAGKFRNFKTNPLRGERRKYVSNNITKWIHWFIVGVREFLSNTLRLLTTRMYLPFLYLLCYPLAALGKVPFLKYFTASVHNNWKVRLQENFDWFSPQYQSHHTKEEVAGWFDEVKLNTVSVLEHGFIPKVGLKGKRS
ncbi:methyltransferase domain-containing protein [bacterium]|nr:MAG: methyltransferase domain-containing protein [bacterium]